MWRKNTQAALLVLVLLGVSAPLKACNETIGDCYPVGQGGGIGDPGAGATGAGSGPGPSGDGLTMAECNRPDNTSTGCSSHKTCVDRYDACQAIDGKCTKGYPGCDRYGATSCASCYEACLSGSAYPPACKCSRCGFTE